MERDGGDAAPRRRGNLNLMVREIRKQLDITSDVAGSHKEVAKEAEQQYGIKEATRMLIDRIEAVIVVRMILSWCKLVLT